jgi:hypothetical protein
VIDDDALHRLRLAPRDGALLFVCRNGHDRLLSPSLVDGLAEMFAPGHGISTSLTRLAVVRSAT